MAFFDEIGKRLNGVAQSAQKSTEITRLQRRISGRQQELDQIYVQIGKLFCESGEAGGALDAMNQMRSSVEAMNKEIDALQVEVDTLRQVRRCPNCGTIANMESRFCAACGAKFPDPPKPVELPKEEAPAQPEEAPAPEPEEAPEAPEAPERAVEITWPEAAAPAEEKPVAEEPVAEEPIAEFEPETTPEPVEAETPEADEDKKEE